jgi:catechol 2,3-dioxygenase-like lactoylglutathione lyase family enzyme
MFDHVTIRVSDRAASEDFYALVLRTLGIGISVRSKSYVEWDDFALALANVETRMMNAKPPTRRLHAAFAAPSREHVDEFWRVGTEAGYRDNGAPGPRPQYRDDYYGAFLLDPDGNSVEAVHHSALRRGGWIDAAGRGRSPRRAGRRRSRPIRVRRPGRAEERRDDRHRREPGLRHLRAGGRLDRHPRAR